MDALETLVAALRAKRRQGERYLVPDLWLDAGARTPRVEAVNPYDFYLGRIRSILNQPSRSRFHGPDESHWSNGAFVYNMFVRLATAWDHDGDGRLDLPVNTDGWRETGSFLKSIALLPYIRSLGCNTIHLLPVTSIGRDGRKGTLGSPYAIRNHYRLDTNLAEPALDVGVETEFKAFVEAAHHLGMRVVVEFVLRTAAKDADWAIEHPEWFYWIRADVPDRRPGVPDETAYGQPVFPEDERVYLEKKFEAQDTTDLLPPPAPYREMFRPPPPAESIRKDEQGRWIGTLPNGTDVRIPGAFTDWPLTGGQPPWTDVTYLRLYDHPDFNYVAYNTLRLYDDQLARPQYRVEPLWERIAGVLPHYQQTYGIDGTMLDMGHALPAPLKQRIIASARAIDPEFGFWAEDFDLAPDAHDVGYDAVMGPLSLGLSLAELDELKPVMETLESEGTAIPNILTAETHNTRRVSSRIAGTQYSRALLALGTVLPGVFWIHNGLELGERQPVNTGVGFQDEEWQQASPNLLPLFSPGALCWTGTTRMPKYVSELVEIRRRHLELLADGSAETITVHEDGPVWCIVRRRPHSTGLALIVNTDFALPHRATFSLPARADVVRDCLSNRSFPMDTKGRLRADLKPGDLMIFELGSDTAEDG